MQGFSYLSADSRDDACHRAALFIVFHVLLIGLGVGIGLSRRSNNQSVSKNFTHLFENDLSTFKQEFIEVADRKPFAEPGVRNVSGDRGIVKKPVYPLLDTMLPGLLRNLGHVGRRLPIAEEEVGICRNEDPVTNRIQSPSWQSLRAM